MFTGIIQQACVLVAVNQRPQFATFVVDLGESLSKDLEIGASVAIDGVCLTVTKIEQTHAHFDLMAETLARTTLQARAAGDFVNIERSLRWGSELGGHQLSGHVDGVAVVSQIQRFDDNCVIHFQLPQQLADYVFEKGFIAVNGVSLTVNKRSVDDDGFSVWLIPETLRRTNLGRLRAGDRVNIEIERQTQVIVDTIQRQLNRLLAKMDEKKS